MGKVRPVRSVRLARPPGALARYARGTPWSTRGIDGGSRRETRRDAAVLSCPLVCDCCDAGLLRCTQWMWMWKLCVAGRSGLGERRAERCRALNCPMCCRRDPVPGSPGHTGRTDSTEQADRHSTTRVPARPAPAHHRVVAAASTRGSACPARGLLLPRSRRLGSVLPAGGKGGARAVQERHSWKGAPGVSRFTFRDRPARPNCTAKGSAKGSAPFWISRRCCCLKNVRRHRTRKARPMDFTASGRARQRRPDSHGAEFAGLHTPQGAPPPFSTPCLTSALPPEAGAARSQGGGDGSSASRSFPGRVRRVGRQRN